MKILKRKNLAALLALSLLASLLPLGAQPALAVEDAPGTLWVGQTRITASGYWKTTIEGNLITGSENDYNVYYDGNGTLTLNGATIQGGTSTGSVPYGAGIYAQCDRGQPVTLTIELIGTNTITGTYGIYVNAEISADSNGTDATLTIRGESNGSLKVSGSSSYGIYVKSGTGNASLTIENASVDATSSVSHSSYAGVCVGSSDSATAPALSLAVDGGSLTASEGNDGIQFIVGSSEPTGATTSLTVSDNAIVRANGGIKASHVDEPTPSGTGIVFDGTEGTVYGNVTLQEDLTISEGESLTIPEGSSLTVPEDKTITVESGGKLEGTPIGNGTVKIAPTITTTESLPDGEVGTVYSQTLTATGDPTITWNVTSGTLPAGLTLDTNTGTISGTPTTANTYSFTVTATNDSGSDSKEYTLTIDPKPTVAVTGVTLNKTELALFTGDSATLNAAVAPDTATNKAVTWESSDTAVATVQDGTVTAVGAGAATITVTTADGNYTATCTVKVTEPSYSIDADPTSLDFGSAYTGYTQPAAQTVTLTNTGNQRVTLVQPTATNFEITTSDNLTLNAGESVKFTIQPKDKLPRGSYSEQITISGNDGASATLTASFTVKEPPYTGKYSYEISTSVGDNGAISVDRYATEGDTVTIEITPDQAYKLDDLSVTAGGKEVTLTAGGDGTYTFTMPSADVKITATFAEDPDWTEPEEPATDVSEIFIDIAANAWYRDAVQYAYDNGLMTGVSANEFAPEQTTTRAMIVSMLARLEGVESANNAGFADVSNEWYATAVNWAANVGVVNGYEDGTFRPNTAITREQLAAILMNYAQYKGQDVSARADLNGYTDQPSTWAEEAMQWAVAEELISGVTNDELQPQSSATRAQVAAILQRFLAE